MKILIVALVISFVIFAWWFFVGRDLEKERLEFEKADKERRKKYLKDLEEREMRKLAKDKNEAEYMRSVLSAPIVGSPRKEETDRKRTENSDFLSDIATGIAMTSIINDFSSSDSSSFDSSSSSSGSDYSGGGGDFSGGGSSGEY